MEHSRPVLEFRLRADPRAPRLARGELDAALAGELDPWDLQDLELSVTEIVTNSIRHAGLSSDDEVCVQVWVHDDALQAQIHDPGRCFPATPTEQQEPGLGWGLRIVDALTRRWGIERNG
ncbi:MAG: ATP-binding protein, partial [Actinomycetota bacterium]